MVQSVQATTLEEHGAVDWIGHLLTALIIALGLRALRLPIPIWSVLIGGLIPDFGHILAWLHLAEPIKGSSRNGSHSLTMVALIVLIAVIDRHCAGVWLGIAIGAITHLWRDMGTGHVPLLWPFSHGVWGVSFAVYVTVTLGIGLVMIAASYGFAQSRSEATAPPIDSLGSQPR